MLWIALLAEAVLKKEAMGFGVHIPFGPILAIASAAYLLFFRAGVVAWFGQLGELL